MKYRKLHKHKFKIQIFGCENHFFWVAAEGHKIGFSMMSSGVYKNKWNAKRGFINVAKKNGWKEFVFV